MPELTPAEVSTLRSQRSRDAKINWYLAVAPYGDPVFTARVNDAGIVPGEREIVYDDSVGENLVEPGMTLWVGSSEKKYDVGRLRIRSIDTGTNTITVAENDDVDWQDDLYLTCPGSYGFRELWGIYPRITEAGGVVTFYEDYDEVYNDPVDDVLPPKANAGPPVCVFLGVGGYVDVWFTGDESFTTEAGASITSYAWDFADGVIQSGAANQAGTCASPNVIRFDAPGFRYVSLTVTDDTGQARTGTVYVPVWIFDRSDNYPALVEVQSQSGDPAWSLAVKAFSAESGVEDVFYNYPDGALVVLFTETEYPDGSADIDGFCGRANIRFVGWLNEESLSFDYDSGTIQFNAISHDARLGQLPGFAYTLEDSTSPSDWYEVADLDIDRALHAHLERRTTTNQVCHVERMNEPARTISVQGFPDASLYAQAQEHLLKDAMSTMLSDRQGVMRVRRNPQFMSGADRNAVDVVVSLVESDLINEIDETRQKQVQFGYVRLGGFAYETPLLAEAPGVAPAQNEAAGYIEGFLVEDQAELNLWAGLWFLNQNNDFKDVPVDMRGNWPVFDPAFQEYVRLTIADPLGRNIFIDQRFIVRKVSFDDSMIDGASVTRLTLEKEIGVLIGDSVTIPAPPPPERPPPPPPVEPVTIPTPDVVIVHNRAKVYSTPNFGDLNPTWTDITGALNGAIFSVEVDHFDGIGAWAVTGTDNVDNNDQANDVGLWRTNDVTAVAPVWTLVFTQKDGSDNRPPWPTYAGGPGCDGVTAQPNWGQLRSVVPTGAGVCIVGEARYHGVTCFLGVDSTMLYKVDSSGAFEVFVPDYAPPGGWDTSCAYCTPYDPCNAGAHFFERAALMNQDEHRGCHQMYFGEGGYTYLTPAGMYQYRSAPDVCQCGSDPPCPLRRNCRPWPPHPDTNPRPPWNSICSNFLGGSTHIIYHDGKWWGQSQSDLSGNAGGIYNDADGEYDDDLWSNYAFCNICSHFGTIYYCKQIGGGINELYANGVATGVTSDLLFGSAGPGYNAGKIGHIRAIWDDVETVVLIRKEEPVLVQPNKFSVWTYDLTNGLQNKTGNLSGITWYGTGRGLPPIAYDHRWDNVGFSAFNVPIR